jgi:hypothetical protein
MPGGRQVHKKFPSRDPSRAYSRKSIAQRRVGTGRCACGETRPEALIIGSHPLICVACQRKKRRLSAVDEHHPAGAANDATTVTVPVNDHRADLSTVQYDWPKRTLENPDRSPLLARAARIRGFIDTNKYLTKQFLQPIPEFDECLAGC